MNNIKLKKGIIYFILIVIFFLQIILIAHRSSFSPNLIFQFYKENTGLTEGIKNKEILSILEIIKKNNLKSFKLSDEIMKLGKFKHRIFEGSYPNRYDKDSNYIITKKLNKNCKLKDKINKIYFLICE